MKQNKISPFLWHYTSFESAIKILESRKLWQTHIEYFTDPTELLHGFEIAYKSILKSVEFLKESEKWKNEYDKYFETLFEILFSQLIRYNMISEMKREYDKNFEFSNIPYDALKAIVEKKYFDEDKKHFFVTSFSSKEDDLYQWMAYANGGKGIAIGFDYNILKEFADSHLESSNYLDTTLLDVQYSERNSYNENLKKELLEMINEYLDTYSIAQASIELTRCIITNKRKAFKGEQEHRLVSLIQYDQIKEYCFRSTDKTLIPYCEFDFDDKINNGIISKIYLGPLINYEQNRPAIEFFKKKFKYDFDIEKSSIELINR